MKTWKSTTILAMVILFASWCGQARGDYELKAEATVPSTTDAGGGPDGLIVDTHTQIQVNTGVTATASRNVSTVCYLEDPSLGFNCEVGTQPSKPAKQIVSSGSLSAEAHSELFPEPDPADSHFTRLHFKARAHASITPTHSNNNQTNPSALARYTGRLHFTGNPCIDRAITADLVFRGRSTAAQSGSFSAANNRYRASFTPDGTWLEPVDSTSATNTNYIVTTLKLDAALVGPGIQDFSHRFAGKLALPETLFKSEGFLTTVELNTDAAAQGFGNDNPDFSVDEDVTLIGFVFENSANQILDLPPGTISITDDAGYRFRVLTFADMQQLFSNLGTPMQLCDTSSTTGSGGDTNGGDNGSDGSGENSCTPVLCGPACPATLSLTLAGLFAMTSRRRWA